MSILFRTLLIALAAGIGPALAQGTGFQLATRHGSATMIMERE